MKIYTKTGDEGFTSLLSGKRVHKTDVRIGAYGTVDELNAYIGLLKDQPVNQDRALVLEKIQNCLFTIGSLFAADGSAESFKIPHLSPTDIEALEKEIDAMQDQLPALRSFILPGGHSSVSFGHLARTICRRAERTIVRIEHHKKIDPYSAKYLNRLSDYLFVLCRKMAQELKAKETIWKGKDGV